VSAKLKLILVPELVVSIVLFPLVKVTVSTKEIVKKALQSAKLI